MDMMIPGEKVPGMDLTILSSDSRLLGLARDMLWMDKWGPSPFHTECAYPALIRPNSTEACTL